MSSKRSYVSKGTERNLQYLLKIERAKEKGWQEAHDDFCDYGPGCTYHWNPYRPDKDKP